MAFRRTVLHQILNTQTLLRLSVRLYFKASKCMPCMYGDPSNRDLFTSYHHHHVPLLTKTLTNLCCTYRLLTPLFITFYYTAFTIRALILLRLWRYINHLLTYLLKWFAAAKPSIK